MAVALAVMLPMSPWACGEKDAPVATEGSTGASETATTSMLTSTSESPGSTSGTQTSAPLPDLPGEACDIWLETCPEGQKCMPVSTIEVGTPDAHRCRPLVPEPDGLYDACTVLGVMFSGLDTCDKHMICMDGDGDGTGICGGMCIGDDAFGEADCLDPRARCWVYEGGIFNLCHPFCDPLLLECEPGETCSATADPAVFICVPDESGEGGWLFSPCESVTECKPGLYCAEAAFASECATPGATGCCLPFCDLTKPEVCPGNGLECLPTFMDEYVPPPPELSHVGLCRLGP